ncbi:MAG TPA: hypothetical protein PKH77_05875 [Anaerolineae bacterium]|nr:hypothetical protein [Anaerolineae bacterium]
MELRQLWKILLRWWWMAAIPVVVVAGYVGLTFRRPPTVYQVVMRFTAGGTPASTLSADYDRYHAWLSSEYIARGLANVADTGAFAEAVARRLADRGLDIPVSAIQGALVTDYAESVTVIYLTWGDGTQIVPLAEEISAEITQNGPTYFPQMGGVGAIARQVDTPIPSALSPSLRAQLTGPGLRLILAAGVGLGLVFLAHYLDPMVRDREDIERLGVTILADVPKRRRR